MSKQRYYYYSYIIIIITRPHRRHARRNICRPTVTYLRILQRAPAAAGECACPTHAADKWGVRRRWCGLLPNYFVRLNLLLFQPIVVAFLFSDLMSQVWVTYVQARQRHCGPQRRLLNQSQRHFHHQQHPAENFAQPDGAQQQHRNERSEILGCCRHDLWAWGSAHERQPNQCWQRHRMYVCFVDDGTKLQQGQRSWPMSPVWVPEL